MPDMGGALLAGMLTVAVVMSVPMKLWMLSGPVIKKRLIPALVSGIGTSLLFSIIYFLLRNPALASWTMVFGVGFVLAMLADGLMTVAVRGEPIEKKPVFRAVLVSFGSYILAMTLTFVIIGFFSMI